MQYPSKYYLHPFFLMRSAALPSKELDELRAPQMLEQLQGLQTREANIERDKTRICDMIADQVPKVEDDQLIKKLIGLKRSLFNLRLNKIGDIGFLREAFAPEEAQQIEAFIKEAFTVEETAQQLSTFFDAELIEARGRAKDAFQKPNLIKGVGHSSPMLYMQARKYFKASNAKLKNKLRKIENSMLIYLTRVAGKTSPFSTFTPVALGKWVDDNASGLRLDKPEMTGQITFKHALGLYLLDTILQSQEAIPFLRWELNSDMAVRDGKVHLIQRLSDPVSKPRAHGTTESAVKLDFSLPVKVLYKVFQDNEFKPFSYEEMRNGFAGIARQEPAKCDGFLHQMIKLQVLIPHTGMVQQCDILKEGAKLLRSIQMPKAQALALLFEDIDRMLVDYTNQPVETRLSLMKQIDVKVKEAVELTQLQVPEEVITFPVYEDVYYKTPNLSLAKDRLQSYRRDLEDVLKIIPLVDYNFRFQYVVSQRFLEIYGEDGVCSDSKAFLTQLTTEGVFSNWSEILTGGKELEKLFKTSKEAVLLDRLRDEFFNRIFDRMENDSDIVLDRDWIQEIADKVPESAKRRTVSQSFFAQEAKNDDGDPLLVLNQIYSGYSVFYSRFLNLATDKDMQEIRDYLGKLVDEGHVLAEQASVFGFNANLHRQLTDHEVQLSPYPQGHRNSIVIQADRLEMVFDKKTARVHFRHPEHGLIDLLFAGFMVPFVLPTKIRLLSQLYTTGLNSVNFVYRHAIRRRKDPGEMRYTPRIQIGNVVLSRRAWTVPQKLIPIKETQETEFEYFKRVNAWYRDLGLPTRSFFKFTPLEGEYFIKKDDGTFEKVDDPNRFSEVDFAAMKPQFIDFEAPLLVTMFNRLVANSPYGIVFQEALPMPGSSEHAIDGDEHVCELLFEMSQVYQEVQS